MGIKDLINRTTHVLYAEPFPGDLISNEELREALNEPVDTRTTHEKFLDGLANVQSKDKARLSALLKQKAEILLDIDQTEARINSIDAALNSIPENLRGRSAEV